MNNIQSEMVVPYHWILDKVKEEPMVIASKMILFRGEKSFRVCLRNQLVPPNTSPVLSLSAVNLDKLGMKVFQVLYSTSVDEKISEMKSSGLKSCNPILQVFTAKLSQMIVGKCTITFRIFVRGSYDGFSYELSDRLLKTKLWESVVKSDFHYLSDITVVTTSKIFPAHKAILAARSPVFAVEVAKKIVNHEIQITDVDPSVVEEFLYFVYTGEPKNSFANDQLLKLAIRYQMGCLRSLCEMAQIKLDIEQITSSMIGIHRENNTSPSLLRTSIEPDKDTESYFDPSSSFFFFTSTFYLWKEKISEKKEFDIIGPKFCCRENVKLCAIHITSAKIKTEKVVDPSLNLTFGNFPNNGFQSIECYHIEEKDSVTLWNSMERREKSKDAVCPSYYSSISDFDLPYNTHPVFSFAVKVTAMFENYRFDLMDKSFTTNLWSNGPAKKFTDVEISAGGKALLAHQVVLSVRSPVFSTLLVNTKKDANGHAKITIDKKFDYSSVYNLIEFLYTGQFKFKVDDGQLLALAELYEVETLVKISKSNNLVADFDQISFDLLTSI